MNISKA